MSFSKIRASVCIWVVRHLFPFCHASRVHVSDGNRLPNRWVCPSCGETLGEPLPRIVWFCLDPEGFFSYRESINLRCPACGFVTDSPESLRLKEAD